MQTEIVSGIMLGAMILSLSGMVAEVWNQWEIRRLKQAGETVNLVSNGT